jgi:hypothetical protein
MTPLRSTAAIFSHVEGHLDSGLLSVLQILSQGES